MVTHPPGCRAAAPAPTTPSRLSGHWEHPRCPPWGALTNMMSLRTIRTSKPPGEDGSFMNQLSGGAQFAMWLAFTGRDIAF